jgi:hypothetical protein
MSFVRQQGFVNMEKLGNLKVALIGCGAIGSHTLLTLTKMGIKNLEIWDPDEVAPHNISNQFFTNDQIGKPKVEAAKAECMRHAPDGVEIKTHAELYKGQDIDANIVIALPDNIDGRNLAFQHAKKNMVTNCYIDGRMQAEVIRILSFNPKDFDKGEKYFEDFIKDVPHVEEPCTAKAIVYNVQMAASIISNYVKRYNGNETIPFEYCFMFPNLMQVKSAH